MNLEFYKSEYFYSGWRILESYPKSQKCNSGIVQSINLLKADDEVSIIVIKLDNSCANARVEKGNIHMYKHEVFGSIQIKASDYHGVDYLRLVKQYDRDNKLNQLLNEK